MRYYTYYENLDLVHIAHDIREDWRRHGTFQRSLTIRKQGKPFYFYEGPPGANGKPGIHHVFCRALKDLFCRYKTMRGFFVERKSGWDTHGLPVELEAEHLLGITKDDIGKKISVEDYNAYCKKTVMRYQRDWEQITEEVGFWLDLKRPYITYDTGYVSVLWGVFKKLYEKGYVYKSYSVQPYSPAAGTGLSTHELNQPGCYKKVKDISIVVQFALKNIPNTYFLAWTTTPWTLPANTALAVDPKLRYVKIQTYNRYSLKPIYVILAASAVHRYFDETYQNAPLYAPKKATDPLPWKIVAEGSGAGLVGLTYHQLLPYITPGKRAFYVVEGDFITTKEGTGIVHIAPSFGADDKRLADKYGLPSITVAGEDGQEVPIVDKKGRFVLAITDFAGQYVKNAYDKHGKKAANTSVDVQIAVKLKKENKAFYVHTHEHTYPYCWRTDKPVLYYPLEAWFIKTTACKKDLIRCNRSIVWHPASTGKRFEDWLENLVDWNITRDRFWGTPLPIWRTQDGKEEKCIGSLKELQQEVAKAVRARVMKKKLPTGFDIHLPYVDQVVLVSEKGKKMYRERGVMDVWFDSGAMPYAQHGNRLHGLNHPPVNFPADFIIEGIDQTRGWFFTLHALAVMLYGSVAFRHVLSTGFVLDKRGQKMSKRLGNATAPMEIFRRYGPDVVRWYMVTNMDAWENMRFDEVLLGEVRRKFFGTLYNTYQFFALYANIDGFKGEDGFPSLTNMPQSDRWILSKLQTLIQRVTDSYENFSGTNAGRAIQQFVINDLSNWYVRLNRKRFWQHVYDASKKSAYQTLHYCLCAIAQLSAPIAPFYMDRLYRDLMGPKAKKSVHLTDFPVVRNEYSCSILEQSMAYAQQISSMVHRLRKKHGIKVRQPLAKILIPVVDAVQQKDITAVMPLILSETNVKTIQFVKSSLAVVTKKIKPNYKRLGKIYGKEMKAIAEEIDNMSQEAIEECIKKGHCVLNLHGETLKLSLEDVVITTENIAGWEIVHHENITVGLDLNRTPALIAEGVARELVNRIQQLRKHKGLAVDDKIELTLASDTWLLRAAFEEHRDYVLQEVQAKKVQWKPIKSVLLPTTFDLEEGSIHVALHKIRE